VQNVAPANWTQRLAPSSRSARPAAIPRRWISPICFPMPWPRCGTCSCCSKARTSPRPASAQSRLPC